MWPVQTSQRFAAGASAVQVPRKLPGFQAGRRWIALGGAWGLGRYESGRSKQPRRRGRGDQAKEPRCQPGLLSRGEEDAEQAEQDDGRRAPSTADDEDRGRAPEPLAGNVSARQHRLGQGGHLSSDRPHRRHGLAGGRERSLNARQVLRGPVGTAETFRPRRASLLQRNALPRLAGVRAGCLALSGLSPANPCRSCRTGLGLTLRRTTACAATLSRGRPRREEGVSCRVAANRPSSCDTPSFWGE